MKRAIANLLLVSASVLVAVAIAETALRLMGISYPAFYTYDDQLGTRLAEGSGGPFTLEGRSWVAINSDGWRDREHAARKPRGVLRIAVIGDSFTEALQVAREATFWSVMENSLGKCSALAGRPVEVLAFGVSGYGTIQQLVLLRERVWKYQPDLVLLAFFAGNDIRNNSPDLEPDWLRPFLKTEGERPVIDNSFRDRPEYVRKQSFAHRSLRMVMLHSRIAQLVGFFKSTRLSGGEQPSEVTGEDGLSEEIYREPADARWVAAWKTTETTLELMRDEVRLHGSRFLLVSLTNSAQVNPDPRFRAALAARLGVADLSYPERRLGAFSARAGIDYLPLVPPMAEYAHATGTCLHGFDNGLPCAGHWNEIGHQVAGERISGQVCSSGILSTASAPQSTAGVSRPPAN